MKKIFTLVTAALLLAVAASAQPRAVGLRFGGSAYSLALGGEFSYQHDLGANSFIDATLGGYRYGANIAATWNYIFANVDNFNIYAGPGANFNTYNNGNGVLLDFGLLAQVGTEYRFGNVPLNIALEWRPGVYFFHRINFSPYGVSFAVRYRF